MPRAIRTFYDRKTEREIPSTWLAQLSSVSCQVLFLVLMGVAGFKLVQSLGAEWFDQWMEQIKRELGQGMVLFLALSLGVGLIGFLFGLLYAGVISRLGHWTHDQIARSQDHQRRQQQEP